MPYLWGKNRMKKVHVSIKYTMDSTFMYKQHNIPQLDKQNHHARAHTCVLSDADIERASC